MISLEHARALPAALVALGFALLARMLRAVSDGGALVGAVIAFMLMLAAGMGGFLSLIAVFLLTLVATRWRNERKRAFGFAERDSGRSASQVLANLGAAGLCSVAVTLFPERSDILLTGAVAALAEAAADTVSSEAGQGAETQPRMILGFRPAAVGINGAVSLQGTLAGCAAAAVVASTGGFFAVVPWRWAPIVAIAGIVGMLLDSVLGETLENRGLMGNDAVNFVSTVFAADLALVAVLMAMRVRT